MNNYELISYNNSNRLSFMQKIAFSLILMCLFDGTMIFAKFNLIFIVCSIIILVFFGQTWVKKVVVTKLLSGWYLIVIFLFVSYFSAIDSILHFHRTLSLVAHILLFILLTNEFSILRAVYLSFDIVPLVYAIVTVATVFFSDSLYSILSPLYSTERMNTIMEYIKYGHFSGLAGEVSFNAFIISIGIIYHCSKAFLLEQSKIKNVIKTIFLLIAMLLCQKRSFLLIDIGLILGCWFYIGAVNRKNILKNIVLVSLMVGLVLLASSIFPQTFAILNRFDASDTTLSGRTIYWEQAMEAFVKNPVFGYGCGTFYNITLQSGLPNEAHNIYVQFLGEVGLLGTIIITGTMLMMLLAGIRLLRYQGYPNHPEIRLMIFVSVFIQLLFIFYGFFGNPFFESFELLTYLITSAMIINLNMNQSFMYVKKTE